MTQNKRFHWNSGSNDVRWRERVIYRNKPDAFSITWDVNVGYLVSKHILGKIFCGKEERIILYFFSFSLLIVLTFQQNWNGICISCKPAPPPPKTPRNPHTFLNPCGSSVLYLSLGTLVSSVGILRKWWCTFPQESPTNIFAI